MDRQPAVSVKRPWWWRVLRPGYRLFERRVLTPVRTKVQGWAREEEAFTMLRYAMQYVQNCELEGDYLEFGSFRGATLTAAYQRASRYNLTGMRFYVFDSFQGLPEIRGVDANGACHYFEGQYSCGLEEFTGIIQGRGVDLNRVTITPGWYDKVLNEATRRKLPLRKAAVVWIDCDLYESTVPALEFITELIQTGTIICFDDWFCFGGDPNRGECRAFREWLARNPRFTAIEYRRFEAAGNSFLISIAEPATTPTQARTAEALLEKG